MLGEKSIEDWCIELDLKNYKIIDGLVNVNNGVNISHRKLTVIPIKFGFVLSFFICYSNKLKSLEGCPKKVKVGNWFNCDYNQLTSLEGAPLRVGHFSCGNNQLISLEGAPLKVSGNFLCHNNKLKSLEGSPKRIGGDFNCIGNPIYTQYMRSIKLKKLLCSEKNQ